MEAIETTHTIWGTLDGDGPIRGIKTSFGDNCILFEVSQDTDDGTYPTVKHYLKDADGLDNEGASHWLSRLTRKKDKTKIDFDSITIIRESNWSNEAVLEFKEPIEIVIGSVGDRQIIEKVKRISGVFEHDWFWTKNGRQSQIANGYEIWFIIHKYLD